MNNALKRFTDEQREAWNAVYGPINEEFKKIYPSMTEKELMSWRYQRYMQDYLACVESVDENVGRYEVGTTDSARIA